MLAIPTHGIERKEHFFLRNVENCSKSIQQNVFKLNFDGNPRWDTSTFLQGMKEISVARS